MIEDVNAQLHITVDTLTFSQNVIALSALRTISEAPPQAGAFAQLLGIKILELGDGRCKAELQIKDHMLNPLGIAHGGIAFTLADSTCGGAALSALGKPAIVTQDMQIRYHFPLRYGTVVAIAETIHHGQRSLTVQCLVRQDEVLIASVTGTFAILSDDEMAAL
jgi:acyl-CoA thioesterase